MDDQGVQNALLFPTRGVAIEHLNPQDISMTYRVFHSFNQWLAEDWGYSHHDRLYAAPTYHARPRVGRA